MSAFGLTLAAAVTEDHLKLLRINQELVPLLRARGAKPAGVSKGELVAAALAAGISYRDLDGACAARLLEKLGHPVSDGELTAMELNRLTVATLSQLCKDLAAPPLLADARKSDFVITLLGAHARHSALNLEQRAALAPSSDGAGAAVSLAAAAVVRSPRSPAATTAASPAAPSRPSPASGAAAVAARATTTAAVLPPLAASASRLLTADDLDCLTVVVLRTIAEDRLGIRLRSSAAKADVVAALIAAGVREGHLAAGEVAVMHAKSTARAARTSPAAKSDARTTTGTRSDAGGGSGAVPVASPASPAAGSRKADGSTSSSAVGPAASGGIAAAVSAAIDAVYAATIGGGRKSPASRAGAVGGASAPTNIDDAVAAVVGIRSGGDGARSPTRASPTAGVGVLHDDASDSEDDVGVLGKYIRNDAEKKLSRHADSVWRYRRNVDLYSGRTRADIEAEAAAAAAADVASPLAATAAAVAMTDPPSPASKAKRHYSPTDVDHIWECQLVAYALTKTDSFAGLYRDPRFYGPVSKVVNSLTPDDHYNLMCTLASINRSKGQVVKKYRVGLERAGRKDDRRFLPYMMGTQADKAAGPICAVMTEAFPAVYEHLADAKREDGHATGSHFRDAADTLERIFHDMDIADALDKSGGIASRVGRRKAGS